MKSSIYPLQFNSDKWDYRFLQVAKLISTWSKDPSTCVGAVIVKRRYIISTGYNGFALGLSDDKNLYLNRELKYRKMIHAEMNAIDNARGSEVEGSTMYIWGLPVCEQCAQRLINVGIKRIVIPESMNQGTSQLGRWFDSCQAAYEDMISVGIECHAIKDI